MDTTIGLLNMKIGFFSFFLDYVEFSCRVLNIPFEFVCRVLRIDDKKPDGLNDFKFSGCINLAQQEEVRGTIGTHVS